jgi:hypothetical protein
MYGVALFEKMTRVKGGMASFSSAEFLFVGWLADVEGVWYLFGSLAIRPRINGFST